MSALADLKVVVMAGGTGGHVYPALSAARLMREMGAEVTWLGTRAGLEARVVPEAGFDIDWIDIGGVRGKGFMTLLLAPLRIAQACIQAGRAMRRRRPGLVLGMGGFVTGPGGVVARLLGHPLVIHEQNARAGLTNRILAHIASRVLEAFPGSFAARVRTTDTGNPVRTEIAQMPPPEQRLAGRSGPLRLLIMGGSLGALVLNETVPRALGRLPEARRPSVRHQAGRLTVDRALEVYREQNVEADVSAYIEDVAEALAWADVAICRAGAITVSELAAAGLGAILVPLPHAVDDHQSANARFLADSGAAVLLPQSDLSADALADLLGELLDRDRLLNMARAARERARPDSAREVVAACLEAAGIDPAIVHERGLATGGRP